MENQSKKFDNFLQYLILRGKKTKNKKQGEPVDAQEAQNVLTIHFRNILCFLHVNWLSLFFVFSFFSHAESNYQTFFDWFSIFNPFHSKNNFKKSFSLHFFKLVSFLVRGMIWQLYNRVESEWIKHDWQNWVSKNDFKQNNWKIYKLFAQKDKNLQNKFI